MSKPPLIELVIDALAAGGDGVGRDASGRVTFVPRTAPGDRVRAELVVQKKQFARGRLDALLAPSPARVEHQCPHFAEGCGGCQWQHVSAAAQAEAKQAILAGALRRALEDGCELAPLITAAPAYHWRRRARFHWVRRRRGRGAVLGLYLSGSRRILDVAVCPQLEPPLEAALAAIREHLGRALHGTGELSMLAGHAGDVHVVIDGRCDDRAFERLLASGAVAGITLRGRTWGVAAVELEPGLIAHAGGFAQASRAGNRALCELVDRAAAPRDGATILELYAGTGNLTRVLRRGATRVIAIDVEVGGALAGEGAPVSWRKGDVAEVTASLAELGQPFDLAVLDPPRTGAAEVLPALITIGPPRIVYVSCDPATLARDVDALRAAGYRATRAQGIDLMPQTSHVEAVVQLTRAG